MGRDEDILAMLAVNLLAPLRLIRAAAAPLRAVRGAVVNVSSIGGVVATPGRAAYGASKAAVNHLTRSLAREFAPDVRVNAVLPGAVDTPMYVGPPERPECGPSLRFKRLEAAPINVPMRAVLGLPFPTPLGRRLMLLFPTGRKTAKKYRRPVSYVRDGDTLLFPVRAACATPQLR